MKEDKGDNVYSQLGKYMGLAFLIPTTTFVGYAIGYMLDRGFGTRFWKPVWLIIGVVAGFVQLIRDLVKDNRDQ